MSDVSPAARRKARHYAMQALYQWHMTGAGLNTIEAEFRVDNDFSKVDSEYFSELVNGVPKNLDTVDGAFTPHLDRDIKEMDPVSLALVRLASYELLHRIDVPFKVVINEAVALAKKFGATDSHKYINGILDKVAHDKRALEVQAERK